MNQKQRTALITGAGQGMGLGVAKHLAAQGIQVVINDIDQAKADAAAAEVTASGGSALAASFDITNTEIALSRIADLDAETSGIDILVNNAGNAGTNPTHQIPFKDMPPEEWDMYIGVNLYGVLNCTRGVLNPMCERGWGRVITISSEAGRSGLDINVSVYGAAKAGAAHLMRHVAREVGPHGVTANVISLGLMDNVPAEFSDRIIPTIPARRLGSGQDVANAVEYLVSDGASWVTGQTLPLNGGSLAI
jgi:NAD(P)-dependent dehydrogenase (short-subunit alcohol dehydrogenase family)